MSAIDQIISDIINKIKRERGELKISSGKKKELEKAKEKELIKEMLRELLKRSEAAKDSFSSFDPTMAAIYQGLYGGPKEGSFTKAANLKSSMKSLFKNIKPNLFNEIAESHVSTYDLPSVSAYNLDDKYINDSGFGSYSDISPTMVDLPPLQIPEPQTEEPKSSIISPKTVPKHRLSVKIPNKMIKKGASPNSILEKILI